MHLDAQLQAEWYKIQEEAKSKTSKLRTDHEALRATQARPWSNTLLLSYYTCHPWTMTVWCAQHSFSDVEDCRTACLAWRPLTAEKL